MGMVLQSIKSIFALLILIGMGFYFAGKKWFGKNGMDFLSKFTVEATLPFYMFYNIYRDLDSRERLLFLITKVPYVFALILMCVCLAAVTAKVCRIWEDRRDTFIVAAGFPNVVFIGFPVIQALWGEGITSVGAIYYIASTVLFWTLGISLLQRGEKNGKSARWAQNIKNLFCPTVVGMFLGMAAVFFRIEVPDFILKPLSMISGVTSPLALVFIGSVIRNMEPSSIKIGKDIIVAVLMRFVMVPTAAVVFLRLLPVTQEMREEFFMLTVMPAMAQMGIMAREYDRDYEFACTVITVTTVISMVTIPVFMYLMQTFVIFG